MESEKNQRIREILEMFGVVREGEHNKVIGEWNVIGHLSHVFDELQAKEIVICAAIRMKDGYIVRGHRHADAIRTAAQIPRYEEDAHRWGDDQGFVTSKGRYVNRIMGAKIQQAAGIKSKMPEGQEYLHGELYSEDLY